MHVDQWKKKEKKIKENKHLASILSRVLERTLLNKLDQFVLTSDNQFGFKPKYGTDVCIYALKEILDLYNRHNSTMFGCFIDAYLCNKVM